MQSTEVRLGPGAAPASVDASVKAEIGSLRPCEGSAARGGVTVTGESQNDK